MADSFSLPSNPSLVTRKRKGTIEREDIEALVEGAAQAPVLTGEGLESYKSSLVEAILENDRQRERHADEPERFFESEAVLYELLHRLEALATDYQLVERLLSSGPVGEQIMASVLSLLAVHPNDDVVEVILRTLLEVVTEDDANSSSSIRSFVSFLERMGVYGALLDAASSQRTLNGETYALILELLQGLLSFETAPCDSEALVEGWPLLLTAAVLDRSLDLELRVTCAEILLGLVSISLVIREQLATGGLTKLLGFFSGSHDEATVSDLVPLVSDIICTCLLEDPCLRPFLEAGGLSSCLALIADLDPALYGPAMQMLSFALLAGPSACERFIGREEGLKYLFPLFMGRHHARLTGGQENQDHKRPFDSIKDMEIICTMLQCLFRHVTVKSEEWRRLVGKFKEHNMEKVDRLITLLKKEDVEGATAIGNKQLETAGCLIAFELLHLPDEDGLAFRARMPPELQDHVHRQVAAYMEAIDSEDPYRQRLCRYL